MNALLSRTNSWHWLLMAMAGCLLLAVYPCRLVWKKAAEENGPKLEGMRTHADELVLLQEEDALLLEHQVTEIQKRTNAYEAVVRQKAGQPIPEGERSVLELSNEINRALQKHQLRVVEQEQRAGEESETKDTEISRPAAGAPREVVQAVAARAAAARAAEQGKPRLPFKTREIRYVVEGEYKQMFMFLVRQSHQKPSYHYRDIRIFPSPQHFGMRMEFTVQIHFT